MSRESVRPRSSRRTTVIGIILIDLLLGPAVYAGIDAVPARYEAIAQAGSIERERIPIWRDTWEMVRGHLIFGRGLGTFHWVFPAYERLEPDTPAKYAHNEYLQALGEVGAVGLALIIWATVFGVLTATALQEITDFALYIPATAVLLAVLIGMNFRAEALGRLDKDGTGDRQPN